MQSRRPTTLIIFMLLMMPLKMFGQDAANLEQLKNQRAVEEIESVLLDTAKLDDPFSIVNVRSKTASLMWRYDRKRSQNLFLDIWKYIDKQSSDEFDHDDARAVLLKYLFPLNPNLADKLLKELAGQKSEEPSLGAQVTGKDPDIRRLANVSAGLVDQDPTLAARLLEQSLAMSVTPAALSVLSRLREKNPTLANFVVSQTLEHIRARPTIIALTGLQLLTAYVFPSQPYFADSEEARSSDETLRFQYFSTAYEVLNSSLQESETFLIKEKRYAANDLRFRAIYQGQVAFILAALAPRYGPQLVEELNALAKRLSGTVPANVANFTRFIVARLSGDQTTVDNPDTAIAIAIANGDFDEARRLINKLEDEAKRKALLQTLARAEFKSRLNEADLSEALNIARTIDNPNLRALLFLQVAKAAFRKDDLANSRSIVSEARAFLSTGEKDGVRARVLLSFASEIGGISQEDAIDLLHNAVIVINSLSRPDPGKELVDTDPASIASLEINDPRGLVDSPELQRAFKALARTNFDGTLIAAGRINHLPLQLIARLATSDMAFANSTKKAGAVKKSAAPPSAGNAP